MGEVNKIMDNISKENAKSIKEVMLGFDSILGVMNFEYTDIPKEVIKIAEERAKARDEKNWTKSDEIRDKIKKMGYTILDEKKGYRIKKN